MSPAGGTDRTVSPSSCRHRASARRVRWLGLPTTTGGASQRPDQRTKMLWHGMVSATNVALRGTCEEKPTFFRRRVTTEVRLQEPRASMRISTEGMDGDRG